MELKSIKCTNKTLITGKSVRINFSNGWWYENTLVHILSIVKDNEDIYIMFKYWSERKRWRLVVMSLDELEMYNKINDHGDNRKKG